jgi:hypothetical protein
MLPTQQKYFTFIDVSIFSLTFRLLYRHNEELFNNTHGLLLNITMFTRVYIGLIHFMLKYTCNESYTMV